jgi:hypothetical protein
MHKNWRQVRYLAASLRFVRGYLERRCRNRQIRDIPALVRICIVLQKLWKAVVC